MLLYKFREPSQIEFTLDIMFNDRLYCADWTMLNDPMEGQFVYSHRSTDEVDRSAHLDDIRTEKKKVRICSLSSTYDSHLLWAHYADGFSGVAIEVDIPDNHPSLVKMEYGGVFTNVNFQDINVPRETARRIFASKYIDWSYEKEFRILHGEHFFELPNPVRRIIVGHRMNPSLFEALRIICERKDIEIYRTGIGDEGIDADSVPALGELW